MQSNERQVYLGKLTKDLAGVLSLGFLSARTAKVHCGGFVSGALQCKTVPLTIPNRTITPWNRGKLIGSKPPLKAKEIWSIRVRLQVAHRIRDLALFNLALDSKLRASDLVALRVGSACS